VGRNLFAGTTIMLVLRCPKDMRAELISSFSDKGEVVMRQPMLLHAFFAQNSLQKADKFTETWADPIYEWVMNHVMRKHILYSYAATEWSCLTLHD
jgi:hypothetical protein